MTFPLPLPLSHHRKAAFLIDFSGKRKHSTPIGLAKEWVTVLQTCYPGEWELGLEGVYWYRIAKNGLGKRGLGYGYVIC